MAIVGYEFLIDGRWVQLQGYGGAIGNGCLHMQDSEGAEVFSEILLKRVRRMLENDGQLRITNERDWNDPLRFEDISPASVDSCRPIMSKEALDE